MRFSLAVGILAQTLTATSLESDENAVLWSRNNINADRYHQRVRSILKRNQAVSLLSSFERNSTSPKFIRSEQQQPGLLRNGFVKNSNVIQECDPNSTDPDIGVLSCGFGRYCQESTDYDLGGVCTDNDSMYDYNIHQRDLQAGTNGDYFAAFCDPLSPTYQRFDCDCSNFDVATGQGVVECDVFDSFCFDVPANTTCAATTLAADFPGDSTYTATFCYYFFRPYEQDVCYTVNYFDSTCSLEFNNVTCSSCSVENSTQVDTYGYPQYCFDFNCTNTEGMHYGSECDGDYVALILGSLLNPPTCIVCPDDMPVINPDVVIGDVTCGELQELGRQGLIPEENCVTTQAAVPLLCGCPQGPTPAPVLAPVCSVCPNDEPVTNPDTIVSVPGQPDATCAELQAFGQIGLIPDDRCSDIQAAVDAQCGCGPETDPPVVSPTDAPVQPTLAPSSVACIVCPDDVPVTNPSLPIELPDQPEVMCGLLQELGREGLIPPDICTIAVGSVPLLCGCGIETDQPTSPLPPPTPAPTPPPPTDAPVQPTETPTATPVDPPTDPPVDSPTPGQPTLKPSFEACIVCPDDEPVTNPDAIIESLFTCEQFQEFGRHGLISPDSCPEAQETVPSVCGCGTGTAAPTQTPGSDPTPNPTASTPAPVQPTESPTGSPTDAPEICFVCAGDEPVTNPDNIVSVPGQPDVTCAELQELGRQGQIPSDLCPAAQGSVPLLCGCGIETDPPTESPMEPPTESPTVAPSELEFSMSLSLSLSMSMSMSMSLPLTMTPTTAPVETGAPTLDQTCIVCPGDEPVMNPDIVIGEITCGQLQEFGRQGLIPPEQCPGAQGTVPLLCGCGVDDTPPPTEGPTPAPTEGPTATPEMSMMMRDRELDSLLDSEFGQAEEEMEEATTARVKTQNVRKRL